MSNRDMRGKQIHFVVMYDFDSNSFEVDYDSQEAVFTDGVIYNTNTNDWEQLEDYMWEDETSAYNRSGDALAEAVRDLKPIDVELLKGW